jgi:redox-sensitive bicupin YhaK (pirin superfamily)
MHTRSKPDCTARYLEKRRRANRIEGAAVGFVLLSLGALLIISAYNFVMHTQDEITKAFQFPEKQ